MCRCILDKQTIADFKDSSVSMLKDSALTLGNQETRQTRGKALSRYSTYLKHATNLGFALDFVGVQSLKVRKFAHSNDDLGCFVGFRRLQMWRFAHTLPMSPIYFSQENN